MYTFQILLFQFSISSTALQTSGVLKLFFCEREKVSLKSFIYDFEEKGQQFLLFFLIFFHRKTPNKENQQNL